MNATYYYKPYTEVAPEGARISKKGTHRASLHASLDSTPKAEGFGALVDNALEFFCSRGFIFGAKAIFGLIALLGTAGVLFGVDGASLSLVSGCICTTLIFLLEYVTENDTDQSY